MDPFVASGKQMGGFSGKTVRFLRYGGAVWMMTVSFDPKQKGRAIVGGIRLCRELLSGIVLQLS